MNKLAFLLSVYACCSAAFHKSEAASPDLSPVKNDYTEAFQVMFSEAGGLRARSENQDNGVITQTSLSSALATLKEVLISSEKHYRISTLFIGDKTKVIESYHKDGEREYLKTLEVHASNGKCFTLRFREGKYVLDKVSNE